MQHDRNFDDLADRFDSRIYQTVKGEWRLKLLKEDLQPFTGIEPLSIWDAGCGHGQISLWLAQMGHKLTLCDVSEKMLEMAQQHFLAANCHAQFHHQSAQSLAAELAQFDVVLCHAVIEWLANPMQSLITIANKVKPEGYLSLLFYNRHAMVYSNVLKGSWRLEPILDNRYLGKGNKLTPPNPQFPHEVVETLNQAGFELQQQTGIRVFHDYMSQQAREKSDEETLFKLEYNYCRQPVYRDMGRYVHMLWKRN